MSNPHNLFLVPTDELCHQEGAEGSMNPISSCGVHKKKKKQLEWPMPPGPFPALSITREKERALLG